jgi:TRAP-type mannitol/chloroaromatic compound transport system permease small subunit
MPEAIKAYVRYVESVNRIVGLIAMYLIVVMLGILFYSAITKAFFLPSLWTLEMAQFVMVAYYLLGGGYSLQSGAHVRMDLIYSRWRPTTKAAVDCVTVLFLIFFLIMLLYGGISSSEYAIKYGEESYSAWAPKMWPIKIIMTVAILLTLLQAIATFFRNVAAARGTPIVTGREISPDDAAEGGSS